MSPASCMVWISRLTVERRGRCVTVRVDAYFVAVAQLEPGEAPQLLDTRTQEAWAGEFTPEEQAEADEALERDREMRRLDEQRWPVAA